MGGNDYTKKERSTFCKRAPTLIRKAHELAEQCNAHVYVLIDHPRARVAYSSTNGGKTPFPDGVLVSIWLEPEVQIVADLPIVHLKGRPSDHNILYPGLQQLTQSGMKDSCDETHRKKVDGVSRYIEFRAQALSKMEEEEPQINTAGAEK
ncbi:hypothetical protein N7475_003572 [Penicillium sp. IBT 31633x]|nr:hypothetical protein N7475_003572 [Penicillium sp. IBT 31633x]